jgi:hypothetical protein
MDRTTCGQGRKVINQLAKDARADSLHHSVGARTVARTVKSASTITALQLIAAAVDQPPQGTCASIGRIKICTADRGS